MKHVKNIIVVSLISTFCASAAIAESTAHELSKHLKNTVDLNEVINSPTLSAATKFCQGYVHDHYAGKQKLSAKEFVDLNAHCIAGNFHTVADTLGVDVANYEPIAGLEFSNGVIKNLSADDADAIKAFHKLKK